MCRYDTVSYVRAHEISAYLMCPSWVSCHLRLIVEFEVICKIDAAAYLAHIRCQLILYDIIL